MARWDNVLSESSRLLLAYASRNPPGRPAAGPPEAGPVPHAQLAPLQPAELDDEGTVHRAPAFAGWRFPRALRWWMHRAQRIQVSG